MSFFQPQFVIEPVEPRRLLSGPYPGPIVPVDEQGTLGQWNPSVAVDGAGNSIVVWNVWRTGTESDVVARRFDPQGQPLGAPFRVNTFTGGQHVNPSVAASASGEFVVVWQNGRADVHFEVGQIHARVFQPDETAGAEFAPAPSLTPDGYMPSVAMEADGDFTIVWGAASGNTRGLLARQYDVTAAPKADPFEVNPFISHGRIYTPRVASNAAGQTVIAWQTWAGASEDTGMYARLVDPAGQPFDEIVTVDLDTPGAIYLTYPSSEPLDVAIDGQGNFVVAWSTASQVDDRIRARRFDATGLALGNAFDLGTAEWSVQAAIAMKDDGEFTVVWDSGWTQGVYGRRFNAVGEAISEEFKVIESTASLPQVPVVAVEPDGDFVVVWQELTGTQPSPAIHLRHFSLIDSVPPVVAESEFLFKMWQEITLRFSEDVSASFDLQDLVIVNLSTGQTLGPGVIEYVSHDPMTYTFTLHFKPNALPDGNYRASLAADAVNDDFGNPMPDDYQFDFFVLAGDANRDRKVDVADLGILASNWQRFVFDFTKGDFDYNGFVNVADLAILAARWQTYLAPPIARLLVVRAPAPRWVDQAALLS